MLGTSRTAAKLERARELGLDVGIDTSAAGFREAVGDPVDVVLDFFGGPAFGDNLAVLKPRGRLVILGTMQGPTAASVEIGRILRGRLEVIGTVMRTRPHEERVELVDAFRSRVLPALADGTVAPVIGATFPMTAMAEAHAAMEGNGVFGKIVVTW